MSSKVDYKTILEQYPETISKEQLRKLCHISKRVAKYYLDNGIIPCQNTGRSTHKYVIATADAVAFLRRRDKHPEMYRVMIRGGMRPKPFLYPSADYDQQMMKIYRQMLLSRIECYPDLMTPAMIAELTGYTKKTVFSWPSFGHMRWFQNGTKFYAPKELVLEHLLSMDYRSIRNRSKEHNELLRELMNRMKEDAK